MSEMGSEIAGVAEEVLSKIGLVQDWQPVHGRMSASHTGDTSEPNWLQSGHNRYIRNNTIHISNASMSESGSGVAAAGVEEPGSNMNNEDREDGDVAGREGGSSSRTDQAAVRSNLSEGSFHTSVQRFARGAETPEYKSQIEGFVGGPAVELIRSLGSGGDDPHAAYLDRMRAWMDKVRVLGRERKIWVCDVCWFCNSVMQALKGQIYRVPADPSWQQMERLGCLRGFSFQFSFGLLFRCLLIGQAPIK